MSIKSLLSLKGLYLIKSSINSNVLLTPLSQQIKQNIANEWIKFNRRVLSLELLVNPLFQNSDPINRCQIKTLKHNYKNYFSDWCDYSSQPIGVFQRFVYHRDVNENTVLDSNKSDCLVFALISPKQQSLQLFGKIQTIHNHWFRNLCVSPLKCQTKMVVPNKQSHKSDIECSLNNKIEGIDQKVEEIVYYRNSSVEEKFGITDCDIILCNLNLDNSLLSFLCDAFTQKTLKNGKTVKKLRINSSLAPFKIAFIFRDNKRINNRLIEITKYLIEMLNEFEISVLPFFANKPVDIKSCDELGIPFAVILDDESIEKGVVAIRNRDTDIEEWVHISNFQKTVCLYLKVIHPSKVKNKAIN